MLKKLSMMILLLLLSFLTIHCPFGNGGGTRSDDVCIDFDRFVQETYQFQQQSNWCWVACASMAFSYYNHPVSQARLVSEIYGAPYNLPAGGGLNLSILLNRDWTDDNGKRFRSTITGVYDFMAGISTLNNTQLISELESEHPIIIGVVTHAVVMICASYYTYPNITSIKVADPWPGNGGVYTMAGAQIVPAYNGGQLIYVCTFHVQDL